MTTFHFSTPRLLILLLFPASLSSFSSSRYGLSFVTSLPPHCSFSTANRPCSLTDWLLASLAILWLHAFPISLAPQLAQTLSNPLDVVGATWCLHANKRQSPRPNAKSTFFGKQSLPALIAAVDCWCAPRRVKVSLARLSGNQPVPKNSSPLLGHRRTPPLSLNSTQSLRCCCFRWWLRFSFVSPTSPNPEHRDHEHPYILAAVAAAARHAPRHAQPASCSFAAQLRAASPAPTAPAAPAASSAQPAPRLSSLQHESPASPRLCRPIRPARPAGTTTASARTG